jgi:3-oxoacyl-[acyl-carrier protein] reductase
MSERLQGRTAVVTGAGSGMGRAIAEAFALEGANVVVQDYMKDAAVEVTKGIVDNGGTAVAVGGDVASAADVDSAVSRAVADFGRLDVMANVAGVFDQSAPCIETTEELWDRLMAINLKGVFLGTKRALQEMLPRKSGVIVNMASIASVIAEGGGAAYTAAKAGVAGFTRQVACEVAPDGIRVNAIGPGLIFTNFFDSSASVLGPTNPVGPLATAARDRMSANALDNIPMHRGGEPEEVARVAVFLASDDSSYVTGQIVLVDGGFAAR